MDSIIGRGRPELFSSRNGLLMCSVVEEHFDAGVLVIVPDLPDRPSLEVLTKWLNVEIRNFKVRIIDQSWKHLDHGILYPGGLTWRELDNRPLKFKSAQRPAARYLYFHYCLQVLRRAWKAGPGQSAAFSLADELGKPIWATHGRYISRNMLTAFAEEVGHHRQEFLVSSTPSDPRQHTTRLIAAGEMDSFWTFELEAYPLTENIDELAQLEHVIGELRLIARVAGPSLILNQDNLCNTRGDTS